MRIAAALWPPVSLGGYSYSGWLDVPGDVWVEAPTCGDNLGSVVLRDYVVLMLFISNNENPNT